MGVKGVGLILNVISTIYKLKFLKMLAKASTSEQSRRLQDTWALEQNIPKWYNLETLCYDGISLETCRSRCKNVDAFSHKHKAAK